MTRLPYVLSALALAGALGAAGCGGGSGKSAEPGGTTALSGSTSTAATTTTQESTQSTQEESTTGGPKTLQIKGLAFIPPNTTVSVGTKLTWKNLDTAQHTVTSDEGNALASQLLNEGQSYSIVLSKAGSYRYYCKVHPFMKGTIVVKPS